jgi:hypothetical protein
MNTNEKDICSARNMAFIRRLQGRASGTSESSLAEQRKKQILMTGRARRE